MTTEQKPISNKWWILLIIGGAILILFFGFRAARSLMRMPPPGRGGLPPETESIRGWMTIPYIANMYNLPPEFIFEKIGIPKEGNEAKSLSDLNSEYFNGEQGKILEMVSKAIMDFREPHKPKEKPSESKPPENKKP